MITKEEHEALNAMLDEAWSHLDEYVGNYKKRKNHPDWKLFDLAQAALAKIIPVKT